MIKFLPKKIINNKLAKLFILEKSSIKFTIKRVYIIKNNSNKKNSRKGHAHKKLEQIISCLNGKIKLKFDDGKKRKSVTINSLSNPIYLKKGIWREVIYLEKNSILHVICSEVFKKKDYIRNYKKFLQWKKLNS